MPSEKPHHELPCREAPFEALYAPAQCFATLPVSLHRPAMIDIGYCRAGDGGRSGRSAQKVKCGQFLVCSDFLAGSSFRPRAPRFKNPPRSRMVKKKAVWQSILFYYVYSDKAPPGDTLAQRHHHPRNPAPAALCDCQTGPFLTETGRFRVMAGVPQASLRR